MVPEPRDTLAYLKDRERLGVKECDRSCDRRFRRLERELEELHRRLDALVDVVQALIAS